MKKQILLVLGIIIAAIVILFALGGGFSGTGGNINTAANAAKLTGFAQCISGSGAKFYGAWWCPHCADQKKEFGDAVKYLPYIECSTPDGNSQTQVCMDQKIQGYPTWKFPNGTQQEGVLTFQQLASSTGCAIPQ